MSVTATFCATLVDEWFASGVRHAVVAPGSRSTPMALALSARPGLHLHVVHDERVAGYTALGVGLDGTPAVLLCTSGTAAANFVPAVVEAGLSAVPMIVVTADRPPELRDVGAPQTIDQTHLFGRAVRWFHDPGVPHADAATSWRSLAARAFDAASDGPVHLNLPFREPLVGTPDTLPPRRPGGPAGPATIVRRSLEAPAGHDGGRGLILAGGRSGVPAPVIADLAAATGWPVLADPTSGARHIDGAVTTADALLRHRRFADAHVPSFVVRIGRPPASKVVGEWVTASGAPVVQVAGPGIIDPGHDVVARCAVEQVAELASPADRAWSDVWHRAERHATAAIESVLGEIEVLNEPAVARTVARSLPDGVELVVASSMPVRDLEWYGGAAARGHANRGANGIDGVVSTALGRALAGHPTVALVGDIAFVHDSNALVALRARGADLRIVVVDNDGGGIFSFLPQAGALDRERFEALFGTPHGTDVVGLATSHGIPARTVTSPSELAAAIGTPGPWLVRVPTDRAANVRIHDAIHAAVAEAITALE